MKPLLKLLISVMLFSCQKQNQRITKEVAIQKHIEDNFLSYQKDYLIIDSFVSDCSLRGVAGYAEKLALGYQVDSFILFNKENNKFITTLNTSSRRYVNASSDLVQCLYGAKISDKWHIYLAYNLIAMRDGYKYDRYEPFTWDELSYVAHEQLMGRFYSIAADGQLIINHERVEEEVNPWKIGGSIVPEGVTEEEGFLILTEYKQSQQIPQQVLDEMLAEYEENKDKKRPPPPKYLTKITWWDKLWGAKEPIFETKEWKEYLRKKYGEKSEH